MLDNLSDKEFENLFRKVSDSQEIEYNPEGWDAMRSMLLKEKRRRRFLWYFLGLTAILLTASIIFIPGSNLQSTNPARIATTSDQRRIDQTNETAPLDPVSNKEIPAIVDNKKELPPDSIKVVAKETFGSRTPNAPLAKNSDVHVHELTKKLVSNPENLSNLKLLETDPSSPKSTMSDGQIGSARIETQSISMDISRSPVRKISNMEHLPSSTLQLIDNSQPVEKFSVTDAATTPIEAAEKKLPISYELGLSREWTSTSLSYLKKGDIRIGIKIDFPISKKLSAGMGMEYYVDRYYINAGEYSPPEGFWTYDVAPLSTYAKCKMLDIPIHLTFHFSGIDKPGVFASIGATSINILKEKYQYTYEKPNPHLIQEWSGSNTGKKIFNSIRLAAGFKFHVKKQWFASVSPYAQIPLSGIGFGDVKLYTVGTTFSVRLQKK